MRLLSKNSYLVCNSFDLRDVPFGKVVYIDFETTSGDPEKTSVDPWHNCEPLGIAYTCDHYQNAYYIPWSLAKHWLPERLAHADKWVNHNIKYDAHVLLNAGLEIPDHLSLVCTQALAHLVHSDLTYEGGYSLDALAKRWLEVRKTGDTLKPFLEDTEDYGDIPIDILADYANHDVLVNRELAEYERQNIPKESRPVAENEIQLTKVLVEMEQTGLHIHVNLVWVAHMHALKMMGEHTQAIIDLIGFQINLGSPRQLEQLICNHFGMPAVARTEKGGASFDKYAIGKYMSMELPGALRKVLEIYSKWKYHAQHNSLFYEPWLKLHKDGVIHPSYNQNLRTGRLSCTKPNAQQMDKAVKQMIVPKPGHVFVSFDYSQVEYRVLVHFVKNQEAIDAYNNDPGTDFHQYIADLCEVTRAQGKTLNFSLAYGQGKKATVKNLANNYRGAGLNLSDLECGEKANKVYDGFHERMPEVKKVGNEYRAVCRQRGYIYNIAKRRLHLPGPIHNKTYFTNELGQEEMLDRTHIALGGRCVQGSAAEIMKYRMVSIIPLLRELGWKMVATVHDEALFQALDEGDEEITRKAEMVREHLVNPIFDLRVPLAADGGYSRVNWAGVKDGEFKPLETTPSTGENLQVSGLS